MCKKKSLRYLLANNSIVKTNTSLCAWNLLDLQNYASLQLSIVVLKVKGAIEVLTVLFSQYFEIFFYNEKFTNGVL